MTIEELRVLITAETKGFQKQLKGVKASLMDLDKTTRRISSGISHSFDRSFNKAFKSFSTVAVVASLTALGKAAIDTASDLEEVQNVVDTSFGEASAEIDEFAKNALKQFGITELEAKRTSSMFMAMANAMGIAAKDGKTLALNLTKLSGDMASFYNVSQKTAETALASVLTGETESMKKFGIVMTEANLSAFALANGISKAYNEMSQAEKVALRYNYVLSNTAKVQGDFAKTSNSWANQVRILKGQWGELLGIIGKGLIAVLTPALRILNQILASLIAIANAMAKAFGGTGIKKVSVSAGGVSSGLEDAAGGAGDLGDNLGEADKKAKKLRKTIAGFDELEILKGQDEDDAGSGSGGAGGGGGGFGFDDFYGDIEEGEPQPELDFNDILKKLDDFILEYTEKANEVGRILGEKLNGLVDYVDWELLGKTMADGFNLVITSINAFLETVDWKAMGVAFATGVNSIFNTVDWEAIGNYVALRLNAIGDLIAGFAETIDWTQVGTSFKTAFETAINNIQWESNGTAIGDLIQGFIDSVGAFFEGGSVAELGTKFSTFINSALASIDATQLGETVNLVVTQLMEAFQNIDFEMVAGKVREFLDALDIPGIIKEYFETKSEFSGDLIAGFFDIPEGTADVLGGIATAIGAVGTAFSALSPFLTSFLNFWTQLTIIMGGNPLSPLATQLSSIGGLFQTTTGEAGLFKGIFDGFSVLFDDVGLSIANAGLKITDFFTVAKAGSGGEALAAQLGMISQNGSTLQMVASKLSIGMGNLWTVIAAHPIVAVVAAIAALVAAFIHAYNTNDEFRARVDAFWNETLKPFFEGIMEDVTTLWEEHIKPVWDKLKEMFSNLAEGFGQIWDDLSLLLGNIIMDFAPAIKESLQTLWDFLSTILGNVFDIIADLLDVLSGVIKFVTGVFTGDWEKAWEGIKQIFEGIWNALGDYIKGVVNTIIGVINTAITAIQNLINLVINGLNKIHISIPDWVPGLGGKEFGFNLQPVSWAGIPYLADGGVIDSPTVAMVGEYAGASHNPEIVTPQSILKETINAGNESLISAMYQMCIQLIDTIQDVDMEVSIGDDVIAQSASRGNRDYQRRTGKPLFAFG